MNFAFPQADNFRMMIFPAALLLYYFICWLMVRRSPRIRSAAPQYDAPPGISPGLARYVLTGGSDGTTLAAILATLAARDVISIQTEGKNYRITLLNAKLSVMPEEAAVLKLLLNVELPAQPYVASPAATIAGGRIDRKRPSNPIPGNDELESSKETPTPQCGADVILDPAAAPQIKSVLDAVQATFRQNLRGVYFRQNFRFAVAGIIATLTWALIVAARLESLISIFLTFWLFSFTSIAGIVIGGFWTSQPAHPTPRQRMQVFLAPILFFVLPGFLIYLFAMPLAHFFVLALLLSVAFNSSFFVLMRAPTSEGRRVLQQLAGFREFLVRVEQDQLERLNTEAEKVAVMNRFLPFAIALDVREGWGDRMAAAFSNAIVER